MLKLSTDKTQSIIKPKDLKTGQVAIIIKTSESCKEYEGQIIMKLYNDSFVSLSDGGSWTNSDMDFDLELLKNGDMIEVFNN